MNFYYDTVAVFKNAQIYRGFRAAVEAQKVAPVFDRRPALCRGPGERPASPSRPVGDRRYFLAAAAT
jgi:hypothetical protein